MADVFDEVREDLRREKLEKAWKRYGIWFLIAAAVVVATVAAAQWWRSDRIHTRRDSGAAYEAALDAAADRKPADAARAMAGYAETAPDGFGAVGWLQAAGHELEAGNIDKALSIYDKLVDEPSTPVDLADVARLRAAAILVDTADRATVDSRLGPTLEPGSPWRYSARELSALAALGDGDAEAARGIYQQLASSQDVPPDLRRRAAEMVRALGGRTETGSAATGESGTDDPAVSE